MISVGGREWGRAAEIAAALGPDVTAGHVRDWHRRGLIDGVLLPGRGRGERYHPLDEAELVERDVDTSRSGRKRAASPRRAA